MACLNHALHASDSQTTLRVWVINSVKQPGTILKTLHQFAPNSLKNKYTGCRVVRVKNCTKKLCSLLSSIRKNHLLYQLPTHTGTVTQLTTCLSNCAILFSNQLQFIPIPRNEDYKYHDGIRSCSYGGATTIR